MGPIKFVATVLALGAVLAGATAAPGARAAEEGYEAGQLQIPFPNGGDSLAADLLITSDGSAIVAGRLIRSSKRSQDGAFLAKLDPEGKLDPTFAEGGLLLDLAGSKATGMATSLALDQQGRVLAAGFSGSDVFVARIEVGGSPDPTFGVDGVFTVPSPESSEITNGDGLEQRSDGKIVVGVRARSPEYRGFRPGAVQVLPDGGLDAGFGDGGRKLLKPRFLSHYTSSRKFDECTGCSEGGLALDRADGVLIAGRKGNAMGLVRLTPDGRIDRGFGERGLARLEIERRRGRRTELVGNSVLVRPNGRLIVTGSMLSFEVLGGGRTRAGFAFAGLTADGLPDRRFAKGAIRAVRLLSNFAVARDAAPTPDGGFAATGYTSALNEHFALAAVDRRGRIDRGQMPDDGAVDGPRNGQANAIAYDSEGRAVLAGYSSQNRQRATLVRPELGG